MKSAKKWMRGLERSHDPMGQPDGDGYIDLETIRAIQRDAMEAMRDRIADGVHRWWARAVKTSGGRAMHPHHLEGRVRSIDIDAMLKEAGDG